MKYYRISDVIDLEIIGKYPQIEEVKCDCDPFEDEDFIDNIGYKKIDFIPKTPVGLLNKGAKLTDSLNSPAIGYSNKLIINDKFRNILKNFESFNFQVFKTKVVSTNDEVTYYWILNPILFNYENIDFTNSTFFELKGAFDKQEKLQIKSLKDFNKEKERINKLGYPYRFKIKNISLNYQNKKDFVIIDNVDGGIGYYVSEKLKKEMQKNLTGIKFEAL